MLVRPLSRYDNTAISSLNWFAYFRLSPHSQQPLISNLIQSTSDSGHPTFRVQHHCWFPYWINDTRGFVFEITTKIRKKKRVGKVKEEDRGGYITPSSLQSCTQRFAPWSQHQKDKKRGARSKDKKRKGHGKVRPCRVDYHRCGGRDDVWFSGE